ncbi:hypothetical protein [Aegicerativicinus sediminis]
MIHFKLWRSLIPFLISFPIWCQTTDLFRVEYLYVPNNKSDNEIQRFRGLFQLPIKVGEGNYLVVGGEYHYIKLDFQDVPFSTEDLGSVQRFEGCLGYLFRTKSDWIFGIRGGLRIVSNFEAEIVNEDLIYLLSGYAIRDRKKSESYDGKRDRFILGILYTSTPGRNFPLPIINYYREFHPDWTYTLGIPKTNIRYKFNQNNHVQAFVGLENFFANIQANKTIDGKLAENISMTTVLGGLGYEYYFTEHLLYYGYAGYTILNDFRLRDDDRNTIYTIDDRNTMYFRTGIKFKF